MAGSLAPTASTALSLDSVSSLTAPGSVSSQSSLNSAIQTASNAYQEDVQPESASSTESGQIQEDGKFTNGTDDYKGSPRGQQGGLESFDVEPIEDGLAGLALFDTSDLELIENALKGFRGQSQTPTRRLSNHELNVHAASEPTNQDAIERLLKKVEAAKEDSRSREKMSGSVEEGEVDSKGIRQVVNAASRAAKAAASAAEKVSSVVNKNSSTIENLCKKLEKTNSDELSMIELEKDEAQNAKSPADAKDRDSKKQSNFAKSLLRQNTITHVILGVMLVTTLAWRYFVYSVGKSVNDTVSNPFAAITDMFGSEEEGVDGDEGPRLKLPFQGPEDDKKMSNRKKKKEQK